MNTQEAGAAEHGAIGLLYPGEMGMALARLLRAAGHRVVTTLEGRGEATRRRCTEANIEVLDTLPALLQTASVVLSVVPPAAALQVATRCCELLPRERHLIYADLNSIAPGTARQVAELFAGTAVDFVDGAISGPASHLCSRCVLYLSGAAAEQIAGLFQGQLRVNVLGTLPGQASALRMLLSGLSKGVVALFVEMAVAARAAGVQDTLLAAYQASYPGVMELVERSLPTFPRHAARRVTEMQEVETTLADLGLHPTIVPGIRALMQEIACCCDGDQAERLSVAEVIDKLHERHLLAQPPALARP